MFIVLKTTFFYKLEALILSTDQGKAVAPLPKVVRRSYTVFRDDFTSGSLNMNNWEYEISMYGGYVSIFVSRHSPSMSNC